MEQLILSPTYFQIKTPRCRMQTMSQFRHQSTSIIPSRITIPLQLLAPQAPANNYQSRKSESNKDTSNTRKICLARFFSQMKISSRPITLHTPINQHPMHNSTITMNHPISKHISRINTSINQIPTR